MTHAHFVMIKIVTIDCDDIEDVHDEGCVEEREEDKEGEGSICFSKTMLWIGHTGNMMITVILMISRLPCYVFCICLLTYLSVDIFVC